MKIDNQKVRRLTKGYGLLGTRYKKNPKYRDVPRCKKVKGCDI